MRKQKHPAQHHRPECWCNVTVLCMTRPERSMEKWWGLTGTHFPSLYIISEKPQTSFLWPPCAYKYWTPTCDNVSKKGWEFLESALFFWSGLLSFTKIWGYAFLAPYFDSLVVYALIENLTYNIICKVLHMRSLLFTEPPSSLRNFEPSIKNNDDNNDNTIYVTFIFYLIIFEALYLF